VALATLLAEAGDVRRSPSVTRFLAHFGWCPADTQRGAYRPYDPAYRSPGHTTVAAAA
jgi:hypothetical protein